MHSRRRRMAAPSREARESITLSSWHPHLGQRIVDQTTSSCGLATDNTQTVVESSGPPGFHWSHTALENWQAPCVSRGAIHPLSPPVLPRTLLRCAADCISYWVVTSPLVRHPGHDWVCGRALDCGPARSARWVCARGLSGPRRLADRRHHPGGANPLRPFILEGELCRPAMDGGFQGMGGRIGFLWRTDRRQPGGHHLPAAENAAAVKLGGAAGSRHYRRVRLRPV